MARLRNMARMSVASAPGTGTITLGSAVTGWLSFANAGIQDGEVVTYFIVDGASREIGRGTYTASGTTLARTTILRSTNSNNAINATTSAQVAIGPSAEDFLREVNAQTGTTYTVLGSDLGKRVTFSNGSAVAVTLPASTSSGLFASGYYFEALNLGAGVVTITPTTSTVNGSSSLVLQQYESATIVADGTNYSAIISAGVSNLATGVATFLTTPSSANLASAVTDETGSGALVFATSPTLVTPDLGTPTALTLTYATGLPVAGITASTSAAIGVGSIELGHASDTTITRTGAGAIAVEGSNVILASNKLSALSATTSAELAGVISDETGSGALVFGTSPTLTNPVVGTQSARDGSTKAASTAYVDTATREKLTANRTYYVRTDGSDSNTGLANTSGGAFLTIQKAYNVISSTLDLCGFVATIQLGDGTYTAGLAVTVGCVGGNVKVKGNATTPSNVVIDTSSCINVRTSQIIIVENLKMQGGSNSCLRAESKGMIELGSGLVFGTATEGHMRVDLGGFIYNQAGSTYTVSGGSLAHMFANGGEISLVVPNVTLTGTPNLGITAYCISGGKLLVYNASYTGSATGTRYISDGNALINTFGGGANYFPGNVAGSTSNGGQYT